MSRATFRSHFMHRTERYIQSVPCNLGFTTTLDLRPARFKLELPDRLVWSKLLEAAAAPVNVAFYLGRVEEVVGNEVVTTIWEYPSGREATTIILVDSNLNGLATFPGDLLRIWTWMELPGSDVRTAKIKVDIERAAVTEDALKSIRAQAAFTNNKIESGNNEA